MNIYSLANNDSGIYQAPVSSFCAGYYNYTNGNPSNRSYGGYFWNDRITSTTSASYLVFGPTLFHPQDIHNKGIGFSIRCVSK